MTVHTLTEGGKMLMLTRGYGNRIRLTLPDGSRVWIDVAGVTKNHVRLGILAPPAVAIDREEMLSEGERFDVVTGNRYRVRSMLPRSEGQ